MNDLQLGIWVLDKSDRDKRFQCGVFH